MNKLSEILALLVKRWSSKSPKRNKVVTNVAGIISVIGGVSLLIPVTYPFWAIAGITTLTGAATIIATGSKLTTTDNDLIKETKKILK